MGLFDRSTDSLRGWFRRVPAPLRERVRLAMQPLRPAARRLVGTADRQHPPGTVKFGSLRRTAPFSRKWGYERGTPIDRVYIEEFLARHADDVRGACLEVMNARYTDRFGGARVTRSDVLDINPANPGATIVADLGEPNSLPAARFDCIVFTQTLHHIPDMQIAVANVWRALCPGGVLLLTVPALGLDETHSGVVSDHWRLTKTGLEWLLSGLPGAQPQVTTYGNVLTCAAFLYGLAAEELPPTDVHVIDPALPLVVAARVRKQELP
jgi:hypothetical protein